MMQPGYRAVESEWRKRQLLPADPRTPGTTLCLQTWIWWASTHSILRTVPIGERQLRGSGTQHGLETLPLNGRDDDNDTATVSVLQQTARSLC